MLTEIKKVLPKFKIDSGKNVSEQYLFESAMNLRLPALQKISSVAIKTSSDMYLIFRAETVHTFFLEKSNFLYECLSNILSDLDRTTSSILTAQLQKTYKLIR